MTASPSVVLTESRARSNDTSRTVRSSFPFDRAAVVWLGADLTR